MRYEDRITEQKKAMHILVTLYSNSSDIPGRTDTMVDKVDTKPKQPDPTRFFKRALKGVRNAATTTTTALGNVASEIAGRCVWKKFHLIIFISSLMMNLFCLMCSIFTTALCCSRIRRRQRSRLRWNLRTRVVWYVSSGSSET